MSTNGALTVMLAGKLGARLKKEYQLLHDHGDQAGPRMHIVSWFDTPQGRSRNNELCQLDMAIVRPDTNAYNAVLLIEMEDTSDKPKTILGDVYATLFGSRITFGNSSVAVDGDTTFLILVPTVELHRPRIEFLQGQIESCRPHGKTGNAQIGHVVIMPFGQRELAEFDGSPLADRFHGLGVLDRA